MNYYVEPHNATPLSSMKLEVISKVIDYYTQHGFQKPATAAELGASGAFMTSLVTRGYARVCGTRENGFQYAGNGLYRKLECNEYCLQVPAEWLWHDYVLSTQRMAGHKKTMAMARIDEAQKKLDEARDMLAKIEAIHF